MSSVMAEDRVDSEMEQVSVFFTLMIIIINKIFNSVVCSDEFYILQNTPFVVSSNNGE